MQSTGLAAKFPRPLSVFFIVLLVISVIEITLMLLLPVVLPSNDYHLQDIADTVSLAVLSAPFIWLFVVRPLKAAAIAEITRTKVALEFIVDAVINFSENGTIQSLNPAAERVFGYKSTEIIGQKVVFLIPGIELGAYPGEGNAPAPGTAFSAYSETVGIRKDKTSFPAEISISELTLQGEHSYIAIVHDISERKKAAEILEEQKTFSLKLLQDSATPCFVLAPDHTILVWNKACEEITGLKSAEMIGTTNQWKAFYECSRPTLADLVIEGDIAKLSSLYGKYARSPFSEHGLQCEGWYLNVGGKSRYIFFDAVPVRNDKCEVMAVIETLEDITDIKIAEESLRVSEEKFFKAFHSSPDGVIINTKADGLFMEANDAFFRMIGYDRKEVIGRTCFELDLWVDPRERAQILERTEAEGAVRNVEIMMRVRSGGIRTFLWSSDVIVLDKKECLIVTVRDITVQKENQRQLLKSKAELAVKHEQLSAVFHEVESIKREWEQILDCISDMVILLDQEGKVKRCNRAMADFVGMPYEAIHGVQWQNLMQISSLPSICIDERCGEFFHERLSRWFFFTCYPYGKDGIQGQTGAVISIHDTTEVKQAATEIEKAYADLKDAQAHMIQQEKLASIGQIAAGVAHEINNPTGYVMSNLGTLGKYVERFVTFVNAQSNAMDCLGTPEEIQKLSALRKQLKIDHLIGDIPCLIEESLEGAGRIKRIVQDMKKFSRINETEWTMADLSGCIDSTINIVWNELKYKVTLKREFSDLPPIKCCPQQLSQVFLNLLVNAGHAIEVHGEITVRTRLDGDTACVDITDTGCGMTDEVSSHIFEPFFTTKKVGEGTGLGLSISYDIVKKHGGDITVDSVVGMGTTFTVRLPMPSMAILDPLPA